MACSFCNKDLYIKIIQYSARMLAPLTRAEELRQKLEDLTGERFILLQHNFCPVCGEQIKKEKSDEHV